MIFAIQISGKYAGDAVINALTYVASNGQPNDTVVMFGSQIRKVMTFEEFIDKMDEFQFWFTDGSILMPLMEWYNSSHISQPMTIISNGFFPEGPFYSVDDFEDWAYSNMMPDVGNITWFNPFLSGMGGF